MDDLSAKLSEILGDPESMEKVRAMAQNLLGDQEESDGSQNIAGGDGETLKKMMGIMTKLRSAGDDQRTALLLALKPHLKEERQQKVDRAVKLLKLIEILPSLKDSGFLDF